MFGVDPGALLESYGYMAVFVGTLLEGESFVLLAGFLAQQGLLSPVSIALAAFCGSVTSDQLMFLLGRWKGMAIIRHFPGLGKKLAKAERLLARYETPLILGFRFIYGMRNITPILMGVGRIGYAKFIVLNVIGAALWAVSFTAAGYFFGQAIAHFLETQPHAGVSILVAMALVLVGVWFWRKRRHRITAVSGAAKSNPDGPAPGGKTKNGDIRQ